MNETLTTSIMLREAHPVPQEWDRWRVAGGPTEPFDVARLVNLPAPERRWQTRALAPGTQLWRSVKLITLQRPTA
ncbi:MAG: hypothetical protein ABI355_18265 [Solirubrobacteraceae bacterium]